MPSSSDRVFAFEEDLIMSHAIKWIATLLLGAAFGASAAATPVETVLYSFTGGTDGALPAATPFLDSSGGIFATTTAGGAKGCFANLGCGAIVEVGLHGQRSVVYRFKPGENGDGHIPFGSLIADAAGNLYTTTPYGGAGACRISRINGCGTVVELSPPRAGQAAWTETVIYDFKGGADGSRPFAGLLRDAAGNFYTTTQYGGSGKFGTVVQLVPPRAGQSAWSERVIHAFQGKDGATPAAGLIADAAGNIYATTYQGGRRNFGAIIRLSPPARGKTFWREDVLYSFASGRDGAFPTSPVARDAAGNLYATTTAGGHANCYPYVTCGTVVRLAPPAQGQTTWNELVLYRFSGGSDGANPQAGIIIDAATHLYTTVTDGGAGGSGAIVEFAPPAQGLRTWTKTVLHSFVGSGDGAGPLAGLAVDSAGNFYTATYRGGSGGCGGGGCGTLVELSGTGFAVR